MADEKHETITDVVRKIRHEIAELRKVSPNVRSIAADWWEARVDEIEAAHKRELSKNVSKDGADFGQLGGAAKLREALLRCDAIAHFPEVRDYQSIKDMRNIIKHALAAPPRNCDVYNNESCRMAYHLHGDGLMTMQAFADWLFAPATEQEGGNNANK